MDVIFDIDGTLLDISHRLHLIGVSDSTAPSERAHPTDSKRWKEFRDPKLKEHDKVIRPVASMAKAFLQNGHRVILCSGRMEEERDATVKSLAAVFGLVNKNRKIITPAGRGRAYLEFTKNIPMYMRADSDYRPDYEAKYDLLLAMYKDGYNPEMAVDDRPAVIRMWRREGLLVADVGQGEEF